MKKRIIGAGLLTLSLAFSSLPADASTAKAENCFQVSWKQPVKKAKTTASQQPAKATTQTSAPAAAAAPAAPATAAAPTTAEVSAFEEQVVALTNEERKKAGLQPLKIDTLVSEVAREKSQDMQQNRYFSHTSPTYGSPFDMMKSFGVTYRSAGENIAKGQQTPEEVVNAWMNSAGHRANILNKSFTHIGVGYEESGNHWTQLFIGK